MSAGDFANWLEGLLKADDAGRARLARPDVLTHAEEFVNGELRPSLVVIFPGGGFVVTINEIARGNRSGARTPGEGNES